VDRQNQVRVQEVQSGRQVRGQAGGYRVQKQARNKTKRTWRMQKENAKSRRTEIPLVDLETYKMNWHGETGNTGINTPGKISDTWRGWRQSQGQMKQNCHVLI
jgi:hypothetical protein